MAVRLEPLGTDEPPHARGPRRPRSGSGPTASLSTGSVRCAAPGKLQRCHPSDGGGVLASRSAWRLSRHVATTDSDHDQPIYPKRARDLTIDDGLSSAGARGGQRACQHVESSAGPPDAAKILQRNVYGWSERIECGLCGLTSSGRVALVTEPIMFPPRRAPGLASGGNRLADRRVGPR
jgi:hypothetical protein